MIFHAAVAERLGLNATDSKVMSLLQRRGRLSAGEITQSTGLTSASVTALIDRLERRGFVRRLQDRNDRRRVMVEPAPEGIARFAPFFESPKRSLGRLFAPYTVEELEVILDFLTRSIERLRAETQHLAQIRQSEAEGAAGHRYSGGP